MVRVTAARSSLLRPHCRPSAHSVTSAQLEEKQVSRAKRCFYFALIFCTNLYATTKTCFRIANVTIVEDELAFLYSYSVFVALLSTSVPVCWVIFCVSSVVSSCACDRIRRFHRERVPILDFITSGLKEVYSLVSYELWRILFEFLIIFSIICFLEI